MVCYHPIYILLYVSLKMAKYFTPCRVFYFSVSFPSTWQNNPPEGGPVGYCKRRFDTQVRSQR